MTVETVVEQFVLSDGDRRIDAALAEVSGYSRSEIKRLIDAGQVCVDGTPVVAKAKWPAGTVVDVMRQQTRSTRLVGEAIPLDIVYEDEWLLVVNKPQGMVVHPGAGHQAGTLVHALIGYLGDASKLSQVQTVERPGIVHRIDKDTSGLILVMKSDEAHRLMAEQIANHDIQRYYFAVVHGHFTEETGTVIAPLGRDPNHRQKMAVVLDGKYAKTHFDVLAPLHQTSFLTLALETGRTHQIRVHMQYIGHPVVGDPIYAGNRPTYGLSGQALHAGQLVFKHPMTGQYIDVKAPLPAYFNHLLTTLGYDQTKGLFKPKRPIVQPPHPVD